MAYYWHVVKMFSVGVRVSFRFDQYIYQESDGMAIVEVILTGDISQDVVVFVLGGMF